MKGQQIWSHLVFKAFFGARTIWSQVPCIECHQHANCFLIWAMCGDPSRKIPQHASWVVMEDPRHLKGIFTRKDSQASGKKIQFNKQGDYANTMHLSNSSLSLIADQYFSSIQSKGKNISRTRSQVVLIPIVSGKEDSGTRSEKCGNTSALWAVVSNFWQQLMVVSVASSKRTWLLWL